MLWLPPPIMCGPPLSSSMLVVAKNEDETRGSMGRWAAPGQGDHDQEKKKPPRWTRIPVLGTPAGAARPPFLNGDGFRFF